jgi:indole-3-acetate monooxygenase
MTHSASQPVTEPTPLRAPADTGSPTGSATVSPEGARAVAAVRSIADELRRLGEDAEEQRALSKAAVDLLAEQNLFNIFVPRDRGGLGLSLADGCAVIEEVSAADGATGWCMLKTTSSNMMSISFPAEVARRMWAGPSDTAAGSLNPKGRAVRVDGGYRLTGRWDWGTASSFSRWLMGGAMVFEPGSDAPAMGPHGRPEMRICFVERQHVDLIDTWHPYGMRGTSSGDFAVSDVFVPEEHAIVPGPVASDYELHRVPSMAWMMVPHASVSIGIARHAVEELLHLATVKTPLGSSVPLKDKEWVQDAIARASAVVASARAYVEKAVADAYGAPGFDPTLATHLSLASTHAAHSCIDAVDLMQRAAGGTAVYLSSPIQRCFRDVHVAASHFLVNVEKYAAAGRAIIEPGRPIIGPV